MGTTNLYAAEIGEVIKTYSLFETTKTVVKPSVQLWRTYLQIYVFIFSTVARTISSNTPFLSVINVLHVLHKSFERYIKCLPLKFKYQLFIKSNLIVF